MRNERDKALADMYQECRLGIDSAHPLKARVQEVRGEYREFTVHHGLVGKAAKARDKWVFLVILCFACIELIVNAWTLGTAHPSGVFGVLSEMILFTVFNVVVGLVIATGWQTRNYGARFRRKSLSGWFLVVFCVAIVALVNFVFGHYRDALVTLQNQIAGGDYGTFLKAWASLFRTALATAFSDEWIPQSMQTVVLIFGGMFMAVVAAYKKYHADDPYPGFGELSRRRDTAEQKYAEEIARIHNRIKTPADEATKELGRIESASSPVVVAERRSEIKSWTNAYRDLVSALNEAGGQQLRRYRRTNGAIKSWPVTLNDSFDRFALDLGISDPPEVPEFPDGSRDVSQLRNHCNEIVLEGRVRYSGVFQLLNALDTSGGDDPATLEKIRQDLDGQRS